MNRQARKLLYYIIILIFYMEQPIRENVMKLRVGFRYVEITGNFDKTFYSLRVVQQNGRRKPRKEFC